MSTYKLTYPYKCTSIGPQNNGLLKSCSFEQTFEGGFNYNCPLCASPLEYVCKGKSVSDVLREGFKKCDG